MLQLGYPIRVGKDTHGLTARSRDFEDFIAAGQCEETLLANALEMLEVTFDIYIEQWKPIPAPRMPTPTEQLVALPTTTALKLQIYQGMHEKCWQEEELARAMGVDLMTVKRLLDMKQNSKLCQLERALAAMNYQIELNVTKS